MITIKFRSALYFSCLLALFVFASCTPNDADTIVDETDIAVVQDVADDAADDIEESTEAVVEEAPTEKPAEEVEPAVGLADRIEITAAGFSVQPPTGYSINLDDPEGIQMMLDGASEDSGPMIAIFGGEFGEEMTPDQMYEFMVLADETLGDVERLPFEGLDGDGFIAEFTNTEGDVTIKGRLMLTLIDGQGSLVTGLSTPEMWDAGFSELLIEVAQSIEYFPPAE